MKVKRGVGKKSKGGEKKKKNKLRKGVRKKEIDRESARERESVCVPRDGLYVRERN